MGRISMPQGKGSQLHNRRDYAKVGKSLPENIDKSRSCENITLVDKDIKVAYEEIFGAALQAYNAKQKRADRKIDDYCEHIKKSKNGEKLFYEDVVQWGMKSDFEDGKNRSKAKDALQEYVKGFEKRNPNLKLIGAYIHMDEASPHLHLDYIPVASGYTRGLSVRNSLDKAMKQMGFIPDSENRKNNATKLWKESERAVFGDICRAHGLEVETERVSERKTLSVDEYKDARDEMLAKLEDEKKVLETEVKELRSIKEHQLDVKRLDELGQPLVAGVTLVRNKDLEELKDMAKAYEAHKGIIKQSNSYTYSNDVYRDIESRERKARDKERELDTRESLVRAKEIRQRDVNELLTRSEEEVEVLRAQKKALELENGDLRADLEQLEQEHWDALKRAYNVLKNCFEAIKMLTNSKQYYADIPHKGIKLIEATIIYAARWAKRDGFPDIANEMCTPKCRLVEGIREQIEPQKAPKRDEWER